MGTAKALLDALESSDATLRVAQLRVLGGAVARVAPDATAYAHRSSRMMANVAAFYEGPADKAGARSAWVDEVSALLHTGDDGAYVNFLADEGEERVRAAYPGATWDRLAAVKATYDPENLFRRNQNVPPSRSADRPEPPGLGSPAWRVAGRTGRATCVHAAPGGGAGRRGGRGGGGEGGRGRRAGGAAGRVAGTPSRRCA